MMGDVKKQWLVRGLKAVRHELLMSQNTHILHLLCARGRVHVHIHTWHAVFIPRYLNAIFFTTAFRDLRCLHFHFTSSLHQCVFVRRYTLCTNSMSLACAACSNLNLWAHLCLLSRLLCLNFRCHLFLVLCTCLYKM